MIINILLTKGYGKGYLPKSDFAMIQPMFPTANLAVRKKVLKEVGLFDTICKTSGEDKDLCIRTAKKNWELFFEPRAIVHHKHRTTFSGLLKQWYGYGSYHPHIFKKHTPPCVEVCYFDRNSPLCWSAVRFYKIFGLPVPIRILIFITPFYFLNFFLALALFAGIFKFSTLLMVSLGAWFLGWLYFSGKDFWENIVVKGDARWVIFSFYRYALNWAYVLGGFIAGLKIGTLHFDVTREKTPAI